MLRALILACFAWAVHSIIVKDPPPSGNEYKYSYEISDPTTGDTKSQHEVRQGDVVSGAYTVLDPDGTKRTVEYTADPKSGFKAVVTKEAGPAPVKQAQNYIALDNNGYSNYEYEAPISSAYESGSSYLKSPIPYYHKSYADNDVPVYFTPSNELKSDGLSFGAGHYFEPSNEYY